MSGSRPSSRSRRSFTLHGGKAHGRIVHLGEMGGGGWPDVIQVPNQPAIAMEPRDVTLDEPWDTLWYRWNDYTGRYEHDA